MTDCEPRRPGPIAQFGLLGGPLLSMIDSSIVNVATPSIMRGLHASLAQAQWVASAYLLALGIGLALVPWCAARLGSSRLYAASLVGFVMASAACSLSPSIHALLVARVVQGVAAAPLVPLAMGALLGSGSSERTVSAAAGIMLFAAPALGPALGGLLLKLGEWPLVFWINVPIGVLAALACGRVPSKVWGTERRSRRFDAVGLAILVPGLAAALYGAERFPRDGWRSLWGGGLVGLGVLLVASYVAYALRARSPIVSVRALPARHGAEAVGLACLAAVINFSTVFLLPTFLQTVQRASVLATGLALLPAGVVTGLAAVAGSKLAGRWGLRPTVLVGFAILAASSALFVRYSATTPLWCSILILCGRGAAVGLVTTPLLESLSAALPRASVDDANTTFNLAQRVSGSVGIAGLAAVFARTHDLVGGLHRVAWILAGLAVLGALGALALPGRRCVRETDPVAVSTPAARA